MSVLGSIAAPTPAWTSLQAAYNQVAANLALITATPKPTYSVEGESYSWQELFEAYTRQMEVLKKQMQAEDLFEFRTIGH